MSGMLYVSDMDGTLLGSDSKISRRSAGIISDLVERGVLFTVATARTPATVDLLLEETRISLPAIVMTGAAEWDKNARQFTRVCYMESVLAEAVDGYVRMNGIVPMRYVIGSEGIIHTYYDGEGPDEFEGKFLAERSNLPLKRVHVNEGCLPESAVEQTVMFFAMGPVGKIMELGEKVRERFKCSVSAYGDIFNKELGFMEIFAPGVSKASAVKSMAERLGAEGITVFGDNLNDLPMMEVATCAVAVGNACEQVKRRADVVIGENRDDSVAEYLASEEGGKNGE